MFVMLSYEVAEEDNWFGSGYPLRWWAVYLNEHPSSNLQYGWIDIKQFSVKPTKSMLRKIKRQFRKEMKMEKARQHAEREWEDCIIDRLGWDVE